jgi:hypothetical protein
MFVWLWGLKDHVKKFSETNGKSGKWVETQIDADHYLAICGDLANRSKHGNYDRPSRSGKSPKLGKVKYQIPQKAMSSITFRARGVGLDVSNSKLIQIEVPVLSEDGKHLGDAFKYLDYALKAWEKIIERAEKAV